jgi:N utilization substance protein B
MKPSQGRYTRKMIMQALYACTVSQNDAQVVLRDAQDFHPAKLFDPYYFEAVFLGILKNRAEVDALIAPLLDRGFSALDPVETAILRMGCYELKSEHSVPYKVVINEAMELAKEYGADQSFKYINSILDKLAKTLRVQEYVNDGRLA